MTPIRVHSDPPRHVAATATIWRLGAALALVLTSAVPVHDAHATNAFASWTANGVPVATDPGNAAVGVPIVDGLGGTYVAWLNTPIGATGYEVRIQHLMRNGERDPRWPASGVLATTTPGTFDVQSDRASGLYVMSGDGVTTMRVTRIREDGSFAPGWPQGGIASQISGAVAWAVGGDGGIWEFGIRLEQQQHCVPGEPCPSYYIVASTRIDPNGTLVPGWEPPGRTLYSSPFVFGYWIIARGFSGGVALLVQWEDPFVGNQYVTEFVHLRPDGTSARARVGVPSHYTTTFWDLDDQGVGLVTLGDFVVSGLQKFAPGPLWANQGYVYPGPLYLVWAQGIVRDDQGGGFLETFISHGSGVVSDIRLNHVLTNGAGDPSWPADGISITGPGLQYQAELRMKPDGRGGVFMAWQDTRSGTDPDIYAQRIAPDLTLPPGWNMTGEPLCALSGSAQTLPYSAADAFGNVFVVWRDTRNGNGDIYVQKLSADLPVPALVQRASARWVEGGAEVTWELSGVDASQLVVERSGDTEAWVTLGAPQPGSGHDQWRLLDTTPVLGERNHYRLREPATSWTGGDVILDAASVSELHLAGLAPNPVDASSRVTFSAASGSAVELVVTDVLGRIVAERRLMDVQPGVQSIAWGDLARLPVGLYWLRARQVEKIVRSRFVVTR